MDDLRTVAVAWWASDGTTSAFDRVDDIVSHRHDLIGSLIAALVETAPTGALGYIGTTVVEDLSFQVDEGDLSREDARRLILDAGLPSSDVFEVLGGAYADRLRALNVAAWPLPPTQIAWLLDEDAQHRRPISGRMLADGDGLRFDPEPTPWQAELARRGPLP